MTVYLSEPTPFDVAEVDRLLTTTRSVRRRLDVNRPVPAELIQQVLEIAIQAPTSHNQQSWRWLVITDEKVRAKIAELFRMAWYLNQKRISGLSGRRRHAAETHRLEESVASLVDTIAKVPALVVPCVMGRTPDIGRANAEWQKRAAKFERDDIRLQGRIGEMMASNFYGSIYPAVWSFQLALRSRGLGSTITCLNLMFPGPFAEVLGLPTAVTPICMMPVAYTIGTDFRPAKRTPAAERTFWNRWGDEKAP
ncbi:nitroreductase family protein [Nonomuraea sp. K274]|uniref:Nitroreductase family protein n=1 Tax=Nonomuraea cypriaca TaxID=1187855 RepID=A0A931A828_9ACTN|nr:nitroreductase family protein [Nonomuraea cypriaca]MBF8186913.1 nitroreductase family protein [Nonomuraea cypriaca]